MRAARILVLLGLACVISTAIAASTWPRPVIMLPQPRFESFAQLFAWITADRELGDPFDEHLISKVQADSHIDHVRDRSPEPSAIVRVELLNPDGTSRARSQDGNFAFYVLRESPKGMILMGRMFGRSYEPRMSGRHLEFEVDLQRSARERKTMHFRVEDNTLLNLSAPTRRFEDVIAGRPGWSALGEPPADWRTGRI
jgi:hypothetical protein